MDMLTLVAVGAALAVLVYVSFTDIRERRIPNKVMFPALAVALTVALMRPERWSLLLGGVVAAALLLLPTFIYGLERAGGGDVKLALFIGLLLGWPSIVPALFVAFAAACLFALGGMALRRINMRSVIAFGPFLALGAVVAGALQVLA